MRPKPMTTNETAAALDIRPQTLRAWRSEGRGPRYTRLGGTSRGWVTYDPAEVRAWITAEKVRIKR